MNYLKSIIKNIVIVLIILSIFVSCKNNPTSNSELLDMVLVEGGTFVMGDRNNTGSSDELPVHNVTLSDYYIGPYEITQKEYESVMGFNPSQDWGIGDDYPVHDLSWLDIIEFCNALSSEEDLTPCYNLNDMSCDFTADGYRLPTEAEWEFAARGGNHQIDNFEFSGSSTLLEDYAWFEDNNEPYGPKEVGAKLPNQLGIYDMSGNIMEFCFDVYDTYSDSSQINPTGPSSGSNRVARGGSYSRDANGCRVSKRYYYHHNIEIKFGFRVVKTKIR